MANEEYNTAYKNKYVLSACNLTNLYFVLFSKDLCHFSIITFTLTVCCGDGFLL
jgi:hypothetical protein